MASLLLAGATPAKAASASETAWSLYYRGKSITARRGLEDFLRGPQDADLARRVSALNTLLEICVRSLADDCLVQYAPQFTTALMKTPTENALQRLEQARRAAYYMHAARLAQGSPDSIAGILQSPEWAYEHAYDPDLYLRRQVLAADVRLRLGQPLEANRAIDKILSLVATLKTSRDVSPTIVWAVSDAMESLAVIGDAERAYGVFRASIEAFGKAIPPLSADAALYELRSGLVLQDVGRDAESLKFLDLAIATLDQIELEPSVRQRLLASALNAKAHACIATAAADCARAVFERHPFAPLYAAPGRAPASFDEVTYLSTRAIAAGFSGATDPVAAAALGGPLGFEPDAVQGEALLALRAVGVALALPPGPGRQASLLDAGRRIRDVALRKRALPFGAWYRASTLDRNLITLALTQAQADPSDDGADVAFTLLQLAARQGRTFDADALTALAQARDEMQRRSIHQAFRLRSRRDELERTALRRATQDMLTGPTTGRPPQADFGSRARFRDYAVRITEAQARFAQDGVTTSGVNLVTLKQLQAALGPDEAALMLAPTVGGTVYMCVRRDSTLRRVLPGRLSGGLVDFKVVQAALTAGHAPSDVLDSQFPAAAAVRLYDVLIRPFEPCLKPGDSIVWLPNLVATGLPIGVLLAHAPPKLGDGYDLSRAEWLVRSHAVTYAGAASSVVAARAATSAPAASFDFLGVGDPRLSGLTADGVDRGQAVLRGVRAGAGFAALAPLPETKDELERSARGFRSATILTDDGATERRVRREVLGAFQYLSFATHGLLRDDIAGLAEPALVLTPVSTQDGLDDGLLTASEIADMNLAARFVALSACNTANFDLNQISQDLPALASAFAVAGTPSTLGTLWPVNSETGKQVVAATFEGLRAGRGAGPALAEAQRAFLAAPPSRAYLHPRFWAPFVILGDGGASAKARAPPLTVASAERITDGAGEVLGVRRSHGRVLIRFDVERDAPAGFAAVTRASGKGWRQASDGVRADGVVAELGAQILVAGRVIEGPRRIFPTIQALDATTGAVVASWRGDGVAAAVSTPMGGAKLDARRAVFGVRTLVLPEEVGRARPKLQAYEVDAGLSPRLLFEVEPPSGGSIDAATFTPLGDLLLATYSIGGAFPYPERPALADEFDLPICGQEALTRVELRDARTGALKASTNLRGTVVNAALGIAGGKVLLGGNRKPACGGERRATVLVTDATLAPKALYADDTLGDSDVRVLAAMADGRVLVAASKDNTVAYAPPTARAAFDSADVERLLYSGMLTVLDRKGMASSPIQLNAGVSLFVTSADASEAGDILVGGGIGDTPMVFHLSASGRTPQ